MKIFGGQDKKVDDLFLVVAFKTQAKTTKSTTSTLQKFSLYNSLLVLLLHTAAVTKDLGTRLRLGGGNCPPAPM